MLKKFFSGFLILLFTSFVGIFIILTTMVVLIQPARVKGWVNKSGLYSTLPNTIINQATTQQVEDSELSLSDPIVQSAAKQVLSPKFLQNSTENIIDSFFVWMRGNSPKPTFAIDVAPIKQSFADNIVQSAISRYQSLPACPKGKLPRSTDPLKIDCRPPYGVDIYQATQSLRNDIIGNKDFLAESTITIDSLQSDNSQKNSIFGEQSPVPRVYKWLQIAPYAIGLLMLITAMGAILLNNSKRRTANKVGSIFIIISALTMIGIWLTWFGIAKIRDQLLSQPAGSGASLYSNVILDTLNALRKDMLITAGIVSSILAIIGIVTLVIVKLKTGKKKLPKSASPDPKIALATKSVVATSPKPVEKPKVKMIKPQQQESPTIITPSQATSAPEVKTKSSKKLIQ